MLKTSFPLFIRVVVSEIQGILFIALSISSPYFLSEFKFAIPSRVPRNFYQRIRNRGPPNKVLKIGRKRCSNKIMKYNIFCVTFCASSKIRGNDEIKGPTSIKQKYARRFGVAAERWPILQKTRTQIF